MAKAYHASFHRILEYPGYRKNGVTSKFIPYEQQKLFLHVGCHIPILQIDSGINGTILCDPVHNILCLSRPTGAYEW